jgi:uncharacterized protein
MPDYKLEIYKDKRGDIRWRRTAENGEIVGASSEGYSSRKHCLANAERNTARDNYRWRCFSPANKKQVGKSTEAFSSKKNAENNARINGWKG